MTRDMKYNQIFHTLQGIRNYVSRHVFIPTLGIKYSHTGNKIFPRWEFLRTSLLLLLLLLTTGANKAWAQTDYSGTYYIANAIWNGDHESGKSGYEDYWYDVNKPNTNWYLVPGANPQRSNKEDAWYSPNYTTQNGDQDRPFLTTYRTNRDNNSIWIIKKTGNYYYIIHALTGKYVKYEPPYINGVSGQTNNNNCHRKAIHLEAWTDPDNDPGDVFKYEITENTRTTTPFITGFNIKYTGTLVSGSHRYFNPSGDNWEYYYGKNNKSPYSLGMVGLWTEEATLVKGALWPHEDAKAALTPTISDLDEETGTFTITYGFVPTGCTLKYTIDGTNPSTSNGMTYSGAVTITGTCEVKAAVVGYGMVLSNISSRSFSPVAAPTVTNNFDGTISLSTTTPNAKIYYTLNGTTPSSSNCTLYSSAFSLGDATVIKAIAYDNAGTLSSEVTTYNVPQYTAPTISFNSSTSQVAITSEGTVYYSTDGSTPTTSSSAYSSPFTVSSGATIKAIATHPGYLASTVASLAISQVATPTIQNNGSNAISITSTTPGATIYYTTDGSTPTTGSTLYTTPLTENVSGVAIKAIAVKENMIPSAVGSGTVTLQCASPFIVRSGNNSFTITCAFPSTGVTIYYTTDGSNPTTSSSSVASGGTATAELPVTVKAMAVATNYENSTVTITVVSQGVGGDGSEANPYTIEYQGDVNEFVSKANTSDGASKHYKVIATSPLDFSGASAITQPFSGTFDGGLQTINGLGHALFNSVNGGTVKNVILKDVQITSGTNVGAICNEATGASRIYNCGVLGTITEEEVKDPNTGEVTNINVSGTSEISGSDNVGSIVGLLDGTSRVINCYSYAVITGGSRIGGIVGYNNVATDAPADATNGQKTMVMNCMFYGDITNGSTTGDRNAPIYNGNIITNVGKDTGVGNYNYFRAGARYVQDKQINVYNCALAAEERYLNRFEFFRHLLNSNRALAAWWASTTSKVVNKDEMMKWELETADRTIVPTAEINQRKPYPYPILKPVKDNNNNYIKYPSVVNIDAAHVEEIDEEHEHYNEGRKLGDFTIYIKGVGGGELYDAPTTARILNSNGAPITDGSKRAIPAVITDKDPERFNFNYYKVQLPYYNDYGTNNYKEQRVVTGWKIVEINGSSSGSGTFSTDSQDATAENGVIMSTPYNFADRKCSNKDLYDVSGRVFNQGAYYDVPEGVSSITIEPYWGKAVYVSDPYLDKVYNDVMTSSDDVETIGGGLRYDNGVSVFNGDDNQKVYTTLANAVAKVGVSSGNVYDNAIVLVGNIHNSAISWTSKDNPKSFTLMSVDMDHDNEPDYSYILRFDGRVRVHPVRIDFLNVIGLGMAQKSDGGTGTYNFGIMQPLGWFEVTNTGLFRVTQFEYDVTGRTESPIILHGGVIEQWVTYQNGTQSEAKAIQYYHVGGNVWFKEFHIGCHQDRTDKVSPHAPISVTGGDYDNFYLTGYYNSPSTNYDDNAECYINGGRFGKVAGTGMQGIGSATNHTNGNIVWQIDNADIDEFYAGGINAAHIAEGNITTVITNSRVDLFCGGPKFGDMNEGKKVFTNATNCTFRVFFGAGYGGNSYNRRYPNNQNSVINPNNPTWDGWISNEYTNKYNATYKGIDTRIDYQFLPMSDNTTNVARLFVDYVSFSLATTRDVTSNLTGCIITTKVLGGRLKDLFQAGNFYGGGNLGKVEGPVKSTLTNCTIEGSAFGGGYSSTLPPVSVMVKTGNKWFLTAPYYDENLGAYLEAKKPATVSATWQHGASNSYDDKTDPEHPVLYTTADLTGLGSISGDVTLALTDTKVGSGENGGSVFGGGEESLVGGSTTVTVTNGTIGYTGAGVDDGNVYGGGRGAELDYEKGLVKGNTTVTINGNPTIKHNIYGGGAFGSVGTFTYDNTTKLPTAVTNGTCTVTVNGGTIGTTGQDNGMVFGSSRGDDLHYLTDGTLVNQMAWVNNTIVVIGDSDPQSTSALQINGSVYGGGENGHNFGDASVTVNKGVIGIAEGVPVTVDIKDPNNPDDDEILSGAAYPHRGNVYGAGCGTDTYMDAQGKIYYNPMAGVVGGNATVTINGGHVVHSVYGAGSMGSVGTYSNNAGTLECTKGGLSTVIVQGNSKVGTPGMTMPDDWGYVFGAGRGASLDPEIYPLIETYQFVNNTELTIGGSALIYGSVYGGSENGHVLNNTHVTIKDQCQIGWGENETEKYTEEQWAAENPSDFSECAHWPFEAPYEPYDTYPITITKDGNGKVTSYTRADEGIVKDGTDGHTFYGNVFGGGSGYFPYGRRDPDQLLALLKLDEGYADGMWLRSAGRVGGSTVVDIKGGHILTSVYGGNECTDVAGSCTVNMSGGTVGVPRNFDADPSKRLVTCYVFGAGKGDPRINFNQWTNVASASVNISGTARIFGSTFGGGEDGHVLGNVETKITAGEVKNGIQYPYIGTTGTSGADGNVFGGGRGFSETALTAGAVCGNVDVKITGGTMLGSVFGGGRLAPVGTHIVLAENPDYGKLIRDNYIQQFGADDLYEQQFNGNGEYAPQYPADVYSEGAMHGHITVNISGGVIGSSAVEGATTSVGEVFGGCKGTSNQAMAHLFGLSKTSTVTISQDKEEFPTHIYNSVYGGGEAGNVKRFVNVTVNGGTIDKDVYGGGKKASTNYDVKDLLVKDMSNEEEKDPTVDSNTLVNLHGGTIKGNVYGGGLGTPEIAAIVGGNVTVNMNYNNGCDNNTNDTDNCVVKGTVFGCNNVNGTPRGNVTVNIYKTVGDKRPGQYELKAVYGGGNEAAYEPTDAYPYMYYYDTTEGSEGYKFKYDYVSYTLDNNTYKPCTYDATGGVSLISGGIPLDDNGTKITNLDDVFRTNVNIYGCNKTSIEEVYGGGNAAPTPATRVTVNGCFEIGTVFGGGNGAGDGNPGANIGYRNYSEDDDANNNNLEKKNYRKSKFSYGTGKAETRLFGGTIKQAFGGSNTLGNVREVAFSVLDQQNDCDLNVGQIYGAGNKAFMDAKIELDLGCITGFNELFGGAFNANINEDVYLKVTSGTFGSVYGGNNVGGHINGTITVEVEETGCHPVNIEKLYGGGKLADYTAPTGREESPIVRVKSATHIGTVYGGGFQANVTGNPTVEINMVKGQHTNPDKPKVLGTVDNVFGGGFEGWVKGNTNVLIGTMPNKSAVITGNVFGGGDNADVIGKTNVQIGYDDLKPTTQQTTTTP